MMRAFLCVFAALAMGFAGTACSGPPADTTGGGGSGGNGGEGGVPKFHAETNGVHITEEAACTALVDAQADRSFKVGCVLTSQTCPAFLRAQFSTACMEYDEGSIQGCIDYYNEYGTCGGLKFAFSNCVVTPYPGTEPAGCP